jgi:putative DNA primase/helicase
MSTMPFSPFPEPLVRSNSTAADLQQLVDDVARIAVGEDITLSDVIDWPQPEPLGSEYPPVAVFDARLLPTSVGPMVEDVADRMQVPLDFPAVVSVVTLAGLCGRRAVIQPKQNDSSWTVVPNLWGGIVAPPGMMKSPVIASITAPVRALEADWRAEYSEAAHAHELAQERAKLDGAVWTEQYKKAAKKHQLAPSKPETQLIPPVQRRLIAVDATPESLHVMLANNPAGVFVLRDELTGWLDGLERQGRESERALYLECWSGDTSFTIDRIGRGSIHVDHCCVSLFGGIQPARLRAYLADALRDGPSNDGLIQRFQLLVWPDAKPEWKYRDRAPNAVALKNTESVYRRIAGIDLAASPRFKFAPDAQEFFVGWISTLEARIRTDYVSPFMRAHLAKYRKLMPALALLFSLADGPSETVGLRQAQQAVDWCDYLESHARRVYASRISPERLAAISLSKRLTGGWKQDTGSFTIRDVYQNDWTGLGTPDETRAAVAVLQDASWVRANKAKREVGRPSDAYTINPKIWATPVCN